MTFSIFHTIYNKKNMKTIKKEDEKKIKFTISINPIFFKKMDCEMINKSKLIESLLKEYYGKKDLL
jgi:hypothetical protein